MQEFCSNTSEACFNSLMPVYEACDINIEELCAMKCIQDFFSDPSNIDIATRIGTDCAEVCSKMC